MSDRKEKFGIAALVTLLALPLLMGQDSGGGCGEPPAVADVPIVYTWGRRDTYPVENATLNNLPIQVDEGANWQMFMDAGRFFTYGESDIVLDENGQRTFLTNCVEGPEICAAQSSTVSGDAQWIVYQLARGRTMFQPNVIYTPQTIREPAFNAFTNELWAYNIATKETKRLTQNFQDVTPKFCGNRLLWVSNRARVYPPYQYSAGNIYPHMSMQVHQADFDNGTLRNIRNIGPQDAMAMSPSCLTDGSIIYSSWQGYSKRGRYEFNTTPQNAWWVFIADGNGANALTIASLGAHNSPYIPTAEKIPEELSDWGGARVSKMLILRPARQVAKDENGAAKICTGNYYRTNHAGGGGEILCYTQSDVEGVSKLNNWIHKQENASSTLEGSAAFVPIDLESWTPWGHGFDNPQRIDKEGRVLGKAGYPSPYPGDEYMFTWFSGACYAPVLVNGNDWGTRKKMGGDFPDYLPTCQLKICKTPLGMSKNPFKECDVLAGDESENVWDAHPVVTYQELFGQEAPDVTDPIPTGATTELRVVDFTEMELTGMPMGDPVQAYKNRMANQGHATPDVEGGRMDKFCVDKIEWWDTLPTRMGYKSQTLLGCVEPEADGSLKMEVPANTPIIMYGIDSKFVFPTDREVNWKECIETRHDMCIVAEDQMMHSLREGEQRTCHGCHDAHGGERWAEVGHKSAEERFSQTIAGGQ